MFLLSDSLRSQPVVFNKVLPPNGRSFTHVTGIVQDHQGYMWFATKKGLYKYDGYAMTTYKNDPLNPNSLSSNQIESICTGSGGTIWIGSFGAGLDLFDPFTGNFKHFRHDRRNAKTIANDTIWTLLQDRQGILWAGTPAGLERLDPGTGNFTHFSHRPKDTSSISSNLVRTLYEDRQGTIWVGTGSPYPGDGGDLEDGGLNRLNQATGTFKRYQHTPGNPRSLINNKVGAIFEDSKGVFWIGTAGDGLHTMNRTNGEFKRHTYDPTKPGALSRPSIATVDPYDHITFIREDASGAMWIGTAGAGLSYYDSKTGKVTHSRSEMNTGGTFLDRNVWTAYSSRDGIFWISSIHGNLYRIDPFHKNIPFEQLDNAVTSFQEGTDSVLWIGTSGGLLRTDRRKGITKLFRHDDNNPASLSNNNINDVIQDSQGNMWIATWQGLNLMKKQHETFIRYQTHAKNPNSLVDNATSNIYKDRKENIWVGTVNGIDMLDVKTGAFTHYKVYPKDTARFGSNMISTIIEDRLGKLWVGCRGSYGLHQFNHANGQFRHFLAGQQILSLCEDSDGIFWAGTDEGLFRFNRNQETFVRFADPASQIFIGETSAVIEDNKKNLWIVSSNGILQLNWQRTEIRKFGKNLIREGNDFYLNSAYKGSRGELYFGTSRGYFTFFPDHLFENTRSPQIVFTDFRLRGEIVKRGNNSPLKESLSQLKTIRLNHNQNVFSFDFVAIDYSNPENNQHLFMLENYDNTWRKSGLDRRAYYFSVPPGSYTFRVRAANSNHVWAERSINIIISPPWWQTWWAYLLFALFIISLVWSFIYYRSRSLVREKKLLEEKVTNRTLEVVKQKEEIAVQRDNLTVTLKELRDTQAQLVQREKMASLGELTAGIAHEIQNPLNFVNNFSEVNSELIEEMKLQIDKGKFEEVKAIANDIKDNEEKIGHHGKRADTIVKGMLQHSRTGGAQKEPTDINALINEYLRLGYHGFRAKDKSFNATLETDFDDTIGNIDIIPQEIGRAVLNLYNNAFYAVDEKKKRLGDGYEPAVSVSTKNADGQVEIRITDNGFGIPEKLLPKIFQPFFTTKPTGQGTGLGLSLTYDIIHAHGGEIKVTTKEGEFSEFVLILPLTENLMHSDHK